MSVRQILLASRVAGLLLAAAPAMAQNPVLDVTDPAACARYSVSAAALVLERESDGSGATLLDSSDGTEALNTSDFNFDEQWGFEVGGAVRLFDSLVFSGRYFQIDEDVQTRNDDVTGGSFFGNASANRPPTFSDWRTN